MCAGMNATACIFRMQVRGQLAGVNSLCPNVGSEY